MVRLVRWMYEVQCVICTFTDCQVFFHTNLFTVCTWSCLTALANTNSSHTCHFVVDALHHTTSPSPGAVPEEQLGTQKYIVLI